VGKEIFPCHLALLVPAQFAAQGALNGERLEREIPPAQRARRGGTACR
jgi:hypothetical protein